MEDVVPLSRGNRDYFQGNYRAIVLYLTTVEAYRTEIENLTGINVQTAKPEPSLVRDGGLSTVWQVTKEKLEFHLEPFTAIVTRGIQFRAMTTWEQIYQSIMGNVEQAITTYADNRFIFNTFEKIEREATRATYKRHQEILPRCQSSYRHNAHRRARYPTIRGGIPSPLPSKHESTAGNRTQKNII